MTSIWQDKNHELDFVLAKNLLLEVKRGRTTALEFSWFVKQFPNKQLMVVNTDRFKTDYIQGIMLEDFLLLD